MNDDQHALANFPGTARLFPLPNLVLFPHVVQPLHVFEPRYRQMTADALAGDRLLAPVLLRPGWESEYEARPAVYPTACLGRILAEQRLDDGRYNLLLRGIARVRITHELEPDTPYRQARVEVCGNRDIPPDAVAAALRQELARLVARWFQALGVGAEQLHKLLNSDLALGPLTDVLSFALPLGVGAIGRRRVDGLELLQDVLNEIL